jgi:hypothetical protein
VVLVKFLVLGAIAVASIVVGTWFLSRLSGQNVTVRASGSDRVVGSDRQYFSGVSRVSVEATGVVQNHFSALLAGGEVVVTGQKLRCRGRGHLTVSGGGRHSTVLIEYGRGVKLYASQQTGIQYND